MSISKLIPINNCLHVDICDSPAILKLSNNFCLVILICGLSMPFQRFRSQIFRFLAGRVSRIGFPDRFSLLTIYRLFLILNIIEAHTNSFNFSNIFIVTVTYCNCNLFLVFFDHKENLLLLLLPHTVGSFILGSPFG